MPPLSSQFLSVEQQLELRRPSSRHRWYCSLQFSSNRQLEIARLSQAICGARWTADSSGEGREPGWSRWKKKGTQREREGGGTVSPPLSSSHPAAAHVSAAQAEAGNASGLFIAGWDWTPYVGSNLLVSILMSPGGVKVLTNLQNPKNSYFGSVFLSFPLRNH